MFLAARHRLRHALDAASEGGAWGGLGRAPLHWLHGSVHSPAAHDTQQLAQRLSAAARRPLIAVVAANVPARAILVGAANLSADCMDVGHHGRGTATDSPLGSLVHACDCAALSDVLVVP